MLQNATNYLVYVKHATSNAIKCHQQCYKVLAILYNTANTSRWVLRFLFPIISGVPSLDFVPQCTGVNVLM